jgi:hypothetical protein
MRGAPESGELATGAAQPARGARAIRRRQTERADLGAVIASRIRDSIPPGRIGAATLCRKLRQYDAAGAVPAARV